MESSNVHGGRMSDIVLKLVVVDGPRTTTGELTKTVQLTTEEGQPTDEDILSTAIALASAIIMKRSHELDLEDQLDDVWNRLAEMVESTVEVDTSGLH